MELVLEDTDRDGIISDFIIDTPMAGALVQLKRVQVNLTADCSNCEQGRPHTASKCSIEGTLCGHLEWLRHFSAKAGVEDLHIRVTVVIWEATEDMYWTKEVRFQDSARLQDFAKHSVLSRLGLRLSGYAYTSDERASFETVSKGSALLSSWTRKNGCVEN